MTGLNASPQPSAKVVDKSSRINSVFEVDGRAIVKIAGPRFRRGLRVYDPREMLRHETECLLALEKYDVAPRVLRMHDAAVCLSWCGYSIDSVSLPNDWLKHVDRLVAAFEECRLIHFDLKASNIVFDGDRIRVIDFGWSYLAGEGFRPKHRNSEWLYGMCRRTEIITNRLELSKIIGT